MSIPQNSITNDPISTHATWNHRHRPTVERPQSLKITYNRRPKVTYPCDSNDRLWPIFSRQSSREKEALNLWGVAAGNSNNRCRAERRVLWPCRSLGHVRWLIWSVSHLCVCRSSSWWVVFCRWWSKIGCAFCFFDGRILICYLILIGMWILRYRCWYSFFTPS